jgi:Sulfotransferase family
MKGDQLPTFLVIGAARAGTTSLYAQFARHPGVYMSPVKEPNFFAVAGERPSYRGPGEDRLQWITELAAYAELFRDAAPEAARGEASVLYLYSPKAAERIQHYVPSAKLIAILRDPVARAFSAFSYLKGRGSEPLDFQEALAAEEHRIEAGWSHIWHYRRMGLYGEQLTRYYERFPAEQIRTVLYDDFEADPVGEMRQLFEFVEVDSSFEPDPGIRYNISGESRSSALALLLRENRLTDRAMPLIKRFDPLVTRIKRRALVRPPIPPSAARELSDYYRDDVERLGGLLGRDVSSWLDPYAGQGSGRPSSASSGSRSPS